MRRTEVFAAGETKVFNIVGNFFRLAAVSGFVSGQVSAIFFRQNEQLPEDLTGLEAGQGVRVAKGFDRVEITSAVAQSVTFQILRGDAINDRVSGEVSVIDGGLGASLAGKAFHANATRAAAAANFSHTQLWNPAGSGVLCAVWEVGFFVTSLNNVVIARSNAALAGVGATVNPLAKYFYQPDSVAENRAENNVAALGDEVGRMMGTSNTWQAQRLYQPIVIGPGTGLIFRVAVVNVGLTTWIQFSQEPL